MARATFRISALCGWLACVFAAAAAMSVPQQFQFQHHDNEQLPQVLEAVHRRCPNITRVYTLGKSVRGVPLYVIEFSSTPGRHQLLKPEFKYIGNMHGNEVLGRELLLKLADHLCEGHRAGDPDIARLVDLTRIHLLPSMNPDGWQTATDTGGKGYLIGRTNNNSVDLNRNFPDLDRIMFGNELSHIQHNNHLLEQVDRLSEPIQPETRAVMKLIMSVPFVLSANLHGGDLVANYPYDTSRSGAVTEYTRSPDDHTFRHLAQSYAKLHKTMSDPNRAGCGYDGYNFGKQGGITNGAAWYSVQGGMQDFNYLSSNDFEITLELGCDKYPAGNTLQEEWENNKDALLHYIWQAHIGVKGQVRDAQTGKPIANAVIHVKNVTDGRDDDIQHDVTSVHDGDYWRLLTPGEYVVTAYRDDYRPESHRVTVVNNPHEEAARLDFELQPASMLMAPLPDEEGPDYEEPYADVLQDKLVNTLRKKWAYRVYKRSMDHRTRH
ncbi:carboxypeptidase E-like [Bacillus rossius redtenbacheri]|uniref:carboxypeptidase E-like n=1 Tax=Bacillus rossius redtenbacheri TaxID=93214 RepID=UPI002FDEBC2D